MKISTQESIEQPTNMFVKNDVSYGEYLIHNMVYNIGGFNVPQIFEYNADEKCLTMQKLEGMSVSDMYGERFENVPQFITDEIRNIISKLYSLNIYYPDITGYNFMYINKKVWIYDFGHAICSANIPDKVKFIKSFIKGKKSWNPDYR